MAAKACDMTSTTLDRTMIRNGRGRMIETWTASCTSCGESRRSMTKGLADASRRNHSHTNGREW